MTVIDSPILTGVFPVIASSTIAAGAAERQNVNSRGWSAAQPTESKSCGLCRVAASRAPDGRNHVAATRLVFVLARNQGFRCAPPPAIQVAPLRGGCADNSHHLARSVMRGNPNGDVRKPECRCAETRMQMRGNRNAPRPRIGESRTAILSAAKDLRAKARGHRDPSLRSG